MSWNDIRIKQPLRFSLKVRLALWFALLFFFSGAVVFLLTGYLLMSAVNANADADLRQIAVRAIGIYAMGARYDQLNELLTEKEYPEPDRMILEHRYPGAEILFVYRTPRLEYPFSEPGSQDYYTACVHYRGGFYEFRVQDGNSVYSRKFSPLNNLPRLKNYLAWTIQARGQDNLTAVILNQDGSDYLALRPPKQSKQLEAVLRMVRSSPVEIGDFRYLRFPVPDGRTLILGRNVQPRDALRNHYILLFFSMLTEVTLIGICAAWLIARRFIRGIKQTNLAMNHISSGDYSYRIADLPDNDREIRELMETFNAMNERTENLLKEIKMMSDNVAHDLRTPLTRIAGTVELLLRDRTLAEPVRSVCVSVAEETSRLKNLVNTIMDISHTNSRPDEICKVQIDLTEQLRDFCEFMQPAFEEKGLSFQLDLPEHPLMVQADKNKLQRVFSNLLENALKFTAQGSVRVAAEEQENEIRFLVQDTGCGISENDCQHVFERFFRSDASRHLQGNGLGLALVQAIVRAHGWQIQLKSVPGKGSIFTIVIPKNPA